MISTSLKIERNNTINRKYLYRSAVLSVVSVVILYFRAFSDIASVVTSVVIQPNIGGVMRIIECNRCHKSKRMDSVTESGYINMDWRNVQTGDLKGDQTFDDWDLIRQLASEGKNLKEIMELTGKSEPTVRKYMKEAESDS